MRLRLPKLYRFLQSENDLYLRSGAFVNFLQWWTPPKLGMTMVQRIEALWISCYEHGFVEAEDVHLIQLWLLALASFGHVIPEASDLITPENDVGLWKNLTLFMPLGPSVENVKEFNLKWPLLLLCHAMRGCEELNIITVFD